MSVFLSVTLSWSSFKLSVSFFLALQAVLLKSLSQGTETTSSCFQFINLAALSRPQSCKGLRMTSSSPLVSTIHIVSSVIAVDSKLLRICFGDFETNRWLKIRSRAIMNVMDVTRTKTMTIEFSFRNQINRMLDILRWVSLLFTKSRNEGPVTSKHILFFCWAGSSCGQTL